MQSVDQGMRDAAYSGAIACNGFSCYHARHFDAVLCGFEVSRNVVTQWEVVQKVQHRDFAVQ